MNKLSATKNYFDSNVLRVKGFNLEQKRCTMYVVNRGATIHQSHSLFWFTVLGPWYGLDRCTLLRGWACAVAKYTRFTFDFIIAIIILKMLLTLHVSV